MHLTDVLELLYSFIYAIFSSLQVTPPVPGDLDQKKVVIVVGVSVYSRKKKQY